VRGNETGSGKEKETEPVGGIPMTPQEIDPLRLLRRPKDTWMLTNETETGKGIEITVEIEPSAVPGTGNGRGDDLLSG